MGEIEDANPVQSFCHRFSSLDADHNRKAGNNASCPAAGSGIIYTHSASLFQAQAVSGLNSKVYDFLRIALWGLRLPMRPLSLPAAGSITALISVGLPESMAASAARFNSSGVVT